MSSDEVKRIYVDTTVQEKNIEFPTDARLYLKGIRLLNGQAQRCGLKPKQHTNSRVNDLWYNTTVIRWQSKVREPKGVLNGLKWYLDA